MGREKYPGLFPKEEQENQIVRCLFYLICTYGEPKVEIFGGLNQVSLKAVLACSADSLFLVIFPHGTSSA